MSLRYAYNTNGLQSHRLLDAVALLADLGYDGIALTPDVMHLDPLAPDLGTRVDALARELSARGLGAVIETGARYCLDPRVKHEPTLLSPEPEGRARRVEFLGRCIEIAAGLGAECVSFWAGVPRAGVTSAQAHDWLRDGLERVQALADARGVVVALEPEPGMLVGDLDAYLALGELAPPLALDVGHCLVTGEREPGAAVRELGARAATITVEDMRRGEHVHLPFGEGDLDLRDVLAAVREVGFAGLICVELSRESHRAHELVGASLAALRSAEG